MSTSTNNDLVAILARARRFVELYQSHIISSMSLIDQVADLVTPDNVEDVIALLPPEVKVAAG